MSAKRRLQFGTPGPSKRARPSAAPPVLYRGMKPEMKHFETSITHTTLASDYNLTAISAGGLVTERIGNRIKVHHVEYIVCQAPGNNPVVRIDLYMPNDASTAATHTYNGFISRTDNSLIKTHFLTAGTVNSNLGAVFNVKLPYGVLTRYADGGPNVNSNAIRARVTTQSNATIGGYFRIWYTDN